MKMLRTAAALAFLLACAPAFAQWQTPNHSVPIGKGLGITGFGSAAPGTSGQPLVSQGASSDPVFGPLGNSGFTPGAADTYKGSLNGTTTADLPRAPCTGINQALRYNAGVGENCGTVTVQTGYDMPVNLGLSSSASGNALTITLTQASGSAPTGNSPVLVPFRSTVASTGTVTWSTIIATQSITVPSGATLGTSNGTPFRIWVFEERNGGTPELAVATCSNPTTIFPCAAWEYSLPTSTTIGGASNSGGVLYATAGVAGDAVRIIGYCEFASGLTTAGTWASSCTTLQTFGPGIKKPGDSIQIASATSTTQTTTTSGTGATVGPTVSISPTSAANIIYATSNGPMTNASASTNMFMWLVRGSTKIGVQGSVSGANTIAWQFPLEAYDQPGTTASTTYGTFGATGAGTLQYPTTGGSASNGAFIKVEEIMG